MGTNYYAREHICKCCGKADKETHIGKASFGWTFSFQATDEIRSYKEWLLFLQSDDIKIFNEYGEEVSLIQFMEIVECHKSANYNHTKEYPEGSFLDEDGNSFTKGDFS
jgi:hypothetical protein